MLLALLALLIHVVAVWIMLEFIQTRWPTLHRVILAAIISALVAFLVAVFRGWICGWLCTP
jgi:hypothetical protein